MKAIAKHWVNYNGVWYMTGAEFEINDADAAEMKQYAKLICNDEQPVNETNSDEPKEPAKRGRKRKAEA